MSFCLTYCRVAAVPPPRLALPEAPGAAGPWAMCRAGGRVPVAAPDTSYPCTCTCVTPSTLWGAAPHPPTPQLALSTLLVIFFSPLVMLHNSFYQLSVTKCLF